MRNFAQIKQELDEAEKNVEVTRQILLRQQERVCELQNELKNADTDARIYQGKTPRVNQLSNEEISRYSRQLIVPGFGVKGQERVSQSCVLIVGMGGLGCPAAQYLSAAGVGKLGLVDYDTVECSNFHRQTLHAETNIGLTKVESARKFLNKHNSHCIIDTYNILLNKHSAIDIISKYDIILDCSDNVPTRYLLNDACVLTKKPLISGSALQTYGQLSVFNHESNIPCYRCLYPSPPPPETVNNCSEAGVLGAVTGVIGALQALEAIKLIVGLGEVLAGRLMIFDGTKLSFRSIKLRGKRKNCDICSENPNIRELIDYEQFCNQLACDKVINRNLLRMSERMNVKELVEYTLFDKESKFTLVDVRTAGEFEICHLPKSRNIPLADILNEKSDDKFESLVKNGGIVFLCRRGNDSQLAATYLRKKFPDHEITDLIGGLYAWHNKIDADFPIY